ncbi:trypco2 family protein [Micromonospora lutea]|uniref:Trypsin-co-occurring domain-containing protein n=1 Tax=Micromonospora lutea TaxID=419825 RepID=A0ABQ4J1N0_9ACTN|nr:trypco2 family protein [Micromonospora lutea]GIJ24103.1 hypothetical protein Vlu01_47270 [Micromonospora lutea]
MSPVTPAEDLTLSEAVQSLREQILHAVDWADDESLTFAIESIEVELEVAVSTVVKGGVKAGLWTVVTVGGDAERHRSATHRVTLTLQPELAGGRVRINKRG